MPFAPPHADAAAPRRTTSRWASCRRARSPDWRWAVGTARRSPTTPAGRACRARRTSPQRSSRRPTRAVTWPPCKADLIRANLALDSAGDTAAQAAEAYNGARWRAEQARQEATDAAGGRRRRARRRRRRSASCTPTRWSGPTRRPPQVQGLAAVVESDGIESMIDRTVTDGQHLADALDEPVRRLHRRVRRRRRHRHRRRPRPPSGPTAAEAEAERGPRRRRAAEADAGAQAAGDRGRPSPS